jgi:hypothetical protein
MNMKENLTVNAFTAHLKIFAGEHGDDQIDAVSSTDNGYFIAVRNKNGTTAKLHITADVVSGSAVDEIDNEIMEYSIRENVFYITRVATWLENNRKLKDISPIELMPVIIQLAERFEFEFGTSADNPIKELEAFAKRELLGRFGA